MKFHRIAPVVVALGLVGALAACGSSSGSSSSTTTKASSATIKTVSDGTLTVATSLPAPGFWNGEDPSSISGGFEYEMAKAIATKAGLSGVKVENVSFDALVAGQSSGYDLALSQVTITDDRKKVVDFTTPYFSSDQGILVKKGVKVPDLAAAKKLKWGVQGSTTGQTFLDETVKPDTEASVFQDTPSMFTALQAGQVEAVLLDTAIVLGQAAESDGALEVVGQFRTGESYGGILPKGSKNLAEIDRIIKELAADGTLTRLTAKWLVPVFKGDPNAIPVIKA